MDIYLSSRENSVRIRVSPYSFFGVFLAGQGERVKIRTREGYRDYTLASQQYKYSKAGTSANLPGDMVYLVNMSLFHHHNAS